VGLDDTEGLRPKCVDDQKSFESWIRATERKTPLSMSFPTFANREAKPLKDELIRVRSKVVLQVKCQSQGSGMRLESGELEWFVASAAPVASVAFPGRRMGQLVLVEERRGDESVSLFAGR